MAAFAKVKDNEASLTWMGALLILALALGVVFITYHGFLNFLMPGEKKLSKKCGRERAVYIATVARIGANNYAQSQTFTKPERLPLSLHSDSDD